jgi:hypothetical protein
MSHFLRTTTTGLPPGSIGGMTFSAIGEAGTRNNDRYLGAALVIATAQLMVVRDGAGADCADDHCTAGGCWPARAGRRDPRSPR